MSQVTASYLQAALISASGARYGAENSYVDSLESSDWLGYEPWVRLLPASLRQCAVCGLHGVRTFDFCQHGPICTEVHCPACGFEYGGNTFVEGITFEEHRLKWQRAGCPWWYSFAGGRQPEDWDPEENFADLSREVQRSSQVRFAERAPELLAYYQQCIDVTLPYLFPDSTERNLLVRARDLLADSTIIGGGSNRIAYRFLTIEVAHQFLMVQPNRNSIVPPLPIHLNLSAAGEPVSISNVTAYYQIERRTTEAERSEA